MLQCMNLHLRDERFIEGVLRNLPLLRAATPQSIAHAVRQCRVLEARRGDAVARRGQPLPGLFVVGYGLVKLGLGGPGARERVWRIVAAGQCFGAPAALLGRAVRWEASALADAKLLVLPCGTLLELVEREPAFALALVRMLAEQASALVVELEAVSLMRSDERLASYLHSLARPAELNGGWTVRLPVSKTLVAARLGMKKETLSRLLRRLTTEGVIEVSRREIAIRDRAALERLIEAHGDNM